MNQEYEIKIKNQELKIEIVIKWSPLNFFLDIPQENKNKQKHVLFSVFSGSEKMVCNIDVKMPQIFWRVHMQQKKCVTYWTLIFQSFHIFSKSSYERRNLLPKHWDKYTQQQVQVFGPNNMPWHRGSSKLPKSLPWSHMPQIYLLIIPNLHTRWQMLLFPDIL